MPIESSPEGVLDKSLEYVEGKAEAGMPQVEHIIDAINVFDIKVVVVVPAYWPSFIEPEPIAAVLEAVIPFDHLGTPHVERVAPTEMGTVIGVRNAAIMAGATLGSNGLSLLPSGLLRLLCALLWLRFLCALLWLGFLRALLWLRFLFVLRLRLVLRRLGFFAASGLFLLAFLCECRNGGSEKQKQNCCADNSILFHRRSLQLMSHLPLAAFSRHTCYTVCAQGCQFTKAHVIGQKCSPEFMGGNYNLEPVGICRAFEMNGGFVPQQGGQCRGSLPEPEPRLSFGKHFIRTQCFPPHYTAQPSRLIEPLSPISVTQG